MRKVSNSVRLAWVAAVMSVFTTGSCAVRGAGSPPSSDREPPGEQQAAPTEVVKSDGARVRATRAIVTGVLSRRGETIEVCPGRSVGACPGIRVEGKVEDVWLSEPGKVTVWRLSGTYDGTTLTLDGPAQPTTLAREPEYRNGCPEFQQTTKGVNPAPRLSATVEALVGDYGERVAGQWWDRDRQTMVVWVTGDASELRHRAAQRAPGARICIQGQARYSRTELERARAKADTLLRERGIVWSSSADDVVHNEILYEAEVIDAGTLAELASAFGTSIHVLAFIELVDADLKQLPAPAMKGDVALVTATTRSGPGMSALGRFSVHYDAEQRCVYFGASGERVLPVWPYGFWATSSPFQVFDYDDNVVARAGDTIELGGGQVDVEHTRAANSCGAKQAWIGYPQSEPARAGH